MSCAGPLTLHSQQSAVFVSNYYKVFFFKGCANGMCQKLCGCHCVSLLLGTARALLWPAEAKALKALSSLAYANAGTVGQAVAPFCAC